MFANKDNEKVANKVDLLNRRFAKHEALQGEGLSGGFLGALASLVLPSVISAITGKGYSAGGYSAGGYSAGGYSAGGASGGVKVYKEESESEEEEKEGGAKRRGRPRKVGKGASGGGASGGGASGGGASGSGGKGSGGAYIKLVKKIHKQKKFKTLKETIKYIKDNNLYKKKK